MIAQGHRYQYEGHSVLAMESATRGLVRVRRIDAQDPLAWMGPAFYVGAEKLEPEPMRYHGGQVPA